MAIRTYGPLPVTILGASNEGGPNYFYDCDFASQRPDPTMTKDGDLAWTRDERKLYVNDTNLWVQIYPLSGAGGVGVSGRESVSTSAETKVITHNQNNSTVPLVVTANWPSEAWESARDANTVTISFGVPAPSGAFISWRAG